MSFSRKAALALTGIAAMAMPLAVAGGASASTSSDYYGTAVYDISFDSAAAVSGSVLRVLPDADGLGDDTEETYHAARFQVTTDAGLVSPWTAWGTAR